MANLAEIDHFQCNDDQLGKQSYEKFIKFGRGKNHFYNKTALIPSFIEAQVRQMPDNIALCFKEKSLTYYELNKRANQLAHYLIKAGLNSRDRVGVYLEPSLET